MICTASSDWISRSFSVESIVILAISIPASLEMMPKIVSCTLLMRVSKGSNSWFCESANANRLWIFSGCARLFFRIGVVRAEQQDAGHDNRGAKQLQRPDMFAEYQPGGEHYRDEHQRA